MKRSGAYGMTTRCLAMAALFMMAGPLPASAAQNSADRIAPFLTWLMTSSRDIKADLSKFMLQNPALADEVMQSALALPKTNKPRQAVLMAALISTSGEFTIPAQASAAPIASDAKSLVPQPLSARGKQLAQMSAAGQSLDPNALDGENAPEIFVPLPVQISSQPQSLLQQPRPDRTPNPRCGDTSWNERPAGCEEARNFGGALEQLNKKLAEGNRWPIALGPTNSLELLSLSKTLNEDLPSSLVVRPPFKASGF